MVNNTRSLGKYKASLYTTHFVNFLFLISTVTIRYKFIYSIFFTIADNSDLNLVEFT